MFLRHIGIFYLIKWENLTLANKVFIGVVSHGHACLLYELGCLSTLSLNKELSICILDNIGESGLAQWCVNNNITYIMNATPKGFAENNNRIFDWFSLNASLTDDDYFVALNPDVVISADSLSELLRLIGTEQVELATVNLYKDKKLTTFDPSVRSFPFLWDFIASYTGFGNKTVLNKMLVTSPIQADWAAGSFLLFKASLYRALGGFDPGYFMYCEDIDICWRAKNLFGQKLIFYPGIKAVHFARHANRVLFSKHFVWHVKSVFRYLLMLYGLRKPYSDKRIKFIRGENEKRNNIGRR